MVVLTVLGNTKNNLVLNVQTGNSFTRIKLETASNIWISTKRIRSSQFVNQGVTAKHGMWFVNACSIDEPHDWAYN